MEITDSFLFAHSVEIRLALAVAACAVSFAIIKAVDFVSSAIDSLSAAASKRSASPALGAAAAR